MRDQRTLIDMISLADPAKDLNVGAPSASPRWPSESAALQTSVAEMPRRRASSLALAGSFAALALFAASVLVLLDPLGQPAPAVATPPLLAFEYEDNPPPARQYLLDLAQRIPVSDAEPAGPVTYIHTKAWSLDIAAKDGETASVVIPWEQEVWHAPDGSAVRKLTRPSPETSSGAAQVTRYDAGEWITNTPLPPSVNLAQLRAQIYANHPQENGLRSAVRGVADLYQGWTIPSSVRPQVMQFLAEQEGLKYRGHVTDRAGRTGIAITADSAEAQDVIVFDEASGQMLAFESIILSAAQALVELPAVFSYVLLLDAGLVADIPGA